MDVVPGELRISQTTVYFEMDVEHESKSNDFFPFSRDNSGV